MLKWALEQNIENNYCIFFIFLNDVFCLITKHPNRLNALNLVSFEIFQRVLITYIISVFYHILYLVNTYNKNDIYKTNATLKNEKKELVVVLKAKIYDKNKLFFLYLKHSIIIVMR